MACSIFDKRLLASDRKKQGFLSVQPNECIFKSRNVLSFRDVVDLVQVFPQRFEAVIFRAVIPIFRTRIRYDLAALLDRKKHCVHVISLSSV